MSYIEPQEVPLIEPGPLVNWIYQPGVQLRVSDTRQNLLPLPPPGELIELLASAENQGFEWILMDGPRSSRPYWIMDIRWSERPTASPKIIQVTQAHCLRIEDLLNKIESLH